MTTYKVYTKAQKRAYAIKMANLAKSMNGGYAPEIKFANFETVNDAFAVTWQRMQNGTINCISGVAQGDGDSQRIGRKLTLISIHIRMRISIAQLESAANPLSDLFGRVCLVWDTQSNNAVPTATDVMDGSQTDDTLAFRNLTDSKRFRVLWDKSWVLHRRQVNEGAINLFASGSESTNIIKYNRKFKKPIQVICSGTGNTIADISDNSLHIIGVANNTESLLSYQIRLRYGG